MSLEKKVCPLGAQNGRTPFLTKKAWPRLDYEWDPASVQTDDDDDGSGGRGNQMTE